MIVFQVGQVWRYQPSENLLATYQVITLPLPDESHGSLKLLSLSRSAGVLDKGEVFFYDFALMESSKAWQLETDAPEQMNQTQEVIII